MKHTTRPYLICLVSIWLIIIFALSIETSAKTVHFKNGKKIDCDYAWQDGNTVFIVVHGKRIAIGYDRNKIDIRKSFSSGEIRPQLNSPSEQNAQTKPKVKHDKVKHEWNPYVKYKHGSSWSGPGVSREIQERTKKSKNYSRGAGGKAQKTNPMLGEKVYEGVSVGNSKSAKYEIPNKKRKEENDKHNKQIREYNKKSFKHNAKKRRDKSYAEKQRASKRYHKKNKPIKESKNEKPY